VGKAFIIFWEGKKKKGWGNGYQKEMGKRPGPRTGGTKKDSLGGKKKCTKGTKKKKVFEGKKVKGVRHWADWTGGNDGGGGKRSNRVCISKGEKNKWYLNLKKLN